MIRVRAGGAVPAGFDLELCQQLVALSRLAYRDDLSVIENSAALGLPDVYVLEDESVRAFIASDRHRQFLVFRGYQSANPDAWLRDARFRTERGPLQGGVHSGMQAALGGLWPEIRRYVTGSQRGSRSLWIGGHSLGGGLAILAAFNLVAADVAVDGVYTFGAPRPFAIAGAKEFQVRMTGRSFRIVNSLDIGTRIPMRIQGYRHGGALVYYDMKGRRAPRPRLRQLLDSVAYRSRHFARLASIGLEPHEIGAYEARVGDELSESALVRTSDRPPRLER